MKRILFLASDLSTFGGIQESMRQFMQNIRDLGAAPYVVERYPGGFFAKASFALRAALYLTFRRPDFTVATNVHFAPIAFFGKKLLGIPYAIIFHGIEAVELTAARKKYAREAEIILSPFLWTIGNVERQVRDIKDKLQLPNPVDAKRF